MKSCCINDLNNFIAGWYIKPKVCDDLIKYFEASPNKHQGLSGGVVDTKKKISLDLSIDTKNAAIPINNYYDELQQVLNKYTELYPYSKNKHNDFGVKETWNIQKYNPNEGYFIKHFERGGHSVKNINRHLVFMTYLNDVKEGGETEFIYQKVKVKPEKGLTLIWGADWTFLHRGIPAPKETKYIATGWFSYNLFIATL